MNLCVNGSRFLEFICLDQCMQSWTVGCVIQEISFNITFLSFLSGPSRAWISSNQARNFHTWLDSYMRWLQLCHRLLLNNLLRDQLAHILLTNNLIPFTLHISHVHLLWLLLINKNISLSKPYAVVMDFHLHIEVFYEAIEERHPIDIGVKAISSPSQYQNRPEEVNEHGVEYRVMVKAGLNVRLAFAQQPEELHDELFELHVTENLLIFGLIKDEREIGVIYDVLDLPDILLEVAVIHLKTKFQVLIVKHSYVGLRVVFENFDHASRVDQVGAEEGWKVGCIDEDVGAFCHLEILQIPHTVNDNQEG